MSQVEANTRGSHCIVEASDESLKDVLVPVAGEAN